MLNDRILNLGKLGSALTKTEEYLSKLDASTPYSSFEHKLQTLGLEKGWGNTAGRVLDSIKLLQDLLQAPDPETLEKFLALIPMVFSVAIVSPMAILDKQVFLVYLTLEARLFTSWIRCGQLRMSCLRVFSYKDWTLNLRLLC
jgi:hypothetical protein